MRAGYLTWQVTLRDLASEHEPQMLVVHTGTGAAPAFDPASAMLAIQRTRLALIAELEARYAAEVERIDGMLTNERAKTDRLARELDALGAGGTSADRPTSNAATAGTSTGDTPGSIPPLGVITLSVLAGATAGFLTAWLAGRPGPSVTLSPAPREPDPA